MNVKDADLKAQILKDLEELYGVAYSCICHRTNGIDNKCPCATKKTQESISLLLKTKRDLERKYEL